MATRAEHWRQVGHDNLQHGHAGSRGYRKATPEYRAWLAAKGRVTNPSDAHWRWYGARGIRMCDEWLHDFTAFFQHIGFRPPGRVLDRIDNDGDYEPGNVRWATRSESNANRRPFRRGSHG